MVGEKNLTKPVQFNRGVAYTAWTKDIVGNFKFNKNSQVILKNIKCKNSGKEPGLHIDIYIPFSASQGKCASNADKIKDTDKIIYPKKLKPKSRDITVLAKVFGIVQGIDTGIKIPEIVDVNNLTIRERFAVVSFLHASITAKLISEDTVPGLGKLLDSLKIT